MVSLWLAVFLVALFLNGALLPKDCSAQEAQMVSSKNSENIFRFEGYKNRWKDDEDGKYKTTEQGLKKLKRLHPIGSKLIPMVQALTASGAVCSRDYKFKNHVLCIYMKGFIVSDHWRVVIKMDENVEIETIKYGKYTRLVDQESEKNKQATIISYQFAWGLDGP